MNNTKTFMGIPLNRFADADSYVGRRLISGERRDCSYPQNGIPEVTVQEGLAPTSANIFGIDVDHKDS